MTRRGPSSQVSLHVSWAVFCLLAAGGLGCGVGVLDGVQTAPPPADGGVRFIFTDASPPVGCSSAGDHSVRTPVPTMAPPTGNVMAADPPPPISGGTMAVLRDGVRVAVADSDRDRVFVVNLATLSVEASIALALHDEPGRVVEDAGGRVHVVLRRAGALATIDPLGAQVVARRPVCSLPRGLAYDAAADRLHVACAGGELVTLAPTGDAPLRTVRLPRDLRDVVVDGSRLLVTRFRSAEVLEVSADGALGSTTRLPWFVSTSLREGQPFAPAVAWRAVALPAGGAVVAHQRGMNGALTEKPGGYGGTSSGFDPCASIVHSAVSLVRPGTRPVAGPPMSSFVLPVDLAVSPDGKRVAVVAAGNSRPGAGSRLFVTEVAGVTDEWTGTCSDDGVHGPRPGISCVADSGAAGSATGQTCYPDLPAVFEPVSVAFTASGQVLVQGREPATLAVSVPGKTLAYNLELKLVGLSSESRADTGHQVFHGDSGAGMACASCHPEGREDGRVWDFTCGGSRRTQSLAGGVSSTEPLHWAGELRDFSHLMEEVFMGRMAGPRLTGEQVGATRRWVDSLPPLPPSRAAGDPQVERGRAIFADPNVGCAAAGCHTGARFTSNLSVAVGTGGVFQVPSLTGVGWREPYLHSGCATTLADRFGKTPCGGGDAHGRTSGLAPSALGDLLAYLDSL